MGLFDDFDIDMDDVKAAGFSNPDDGTYAFVISEAHLQNGTKKKPDNTFFVITYSLDEAGTKQEWFTVAEDGEMTARAKQSLSFLKSRLIDLGFEGSLNDISPDDMEGISGSLKLVTTKSGAAEYQNIKNVQVVDSEYQESDDDEDEVEASDRKLKAQVAAKQKARAAAPAKKAPVRKAPAKKAPEPEEDDDDNPFE